jgi:hypothetical protein
MQKEIEGCKNGLEEKVPTSKHRGITYDKTNKKYQLHVMINKKQVQLGRFKTELEAYNYKIEFLYGFSRKSQEVGEFHVSDVRVVDNHKKELIRLLESGEVSPNKKSKILFTLSQIHNYSKQL